MRRLLLALTLATVLLGVAPLAQNALVQKIGVQPAAQDLITTLAGGTGDAGAVDWELCCVYGNPGCCLAFLIELWWEGSIDFPTD